MDSEISRPTPEKTTVDGIRVLFTAEEIARRRAEIAAAISRDYAGDELLMVCILKGSMPFFVDLSRELTVPVRHDSIGVSSYFGGTESSGTVELVSDLSEPIAGKHVLLVEDIVDSGRTMKFVLDLLGERGPASLRLASLLDKPSRRQVDVEIGYVGFTIPDEFVVGYGLDHEQRHRNLPYIGVLDGTRPGMGVDRGDGIR
ncbi:MAG: hypoxanthine phosphoribosyltransferase [Planctomycetota bacterium]|nr:hypoxanthine phosphoribosyltransferase [Planctomycetota bacterium]